MNGNAIQEAQLDFGWSVSDIEKCILKLKNSHCYKSEQHKRYPNCYVDYYRAPNLHEGENVYTHLFVDGGRVIINSFKELYK